jgi:hypothetical protein
LIDAFVGNIGFLYKGFVVEDNRHFEQVDDNR